MIGHSLALRRVLVGTPNTDRRWDPIAKHISNPDAGAMFENRNRKSQITNHKKARFNCVRLAWVAFAVVSECPVLAARAVVAAGFCHGAVCAPSQTTEDTDCYKDG